MHSVHDFKRKREVVYFCVASLFSVIFRLILKHLETEDTTCDTISRREALLIIPWAYAGQPIVCVFIFSPSITGFDGKHYLM